MSDAREAILAVKDMPEVQRKWLLDMLDRQERNDLWDPPHPIGIDFGPAVVADYLRRHGQEWTAQPLPDEYERAEPQQCFTNATQLVVANDDLRYCEGYLHRPGSGFAFLHAWAVDEDGMVIDPTIDNPEECRYWGVAYETDEYLAHIVDKKFYGVLGGDFLDGVAVLENDGI